MIESKKVLRLMAAALVLLLLAACGAEAISIDQIPPYPGAQQIERGQNSLADSVADAMRQSAGEQGLNAQFRFFSLPGGTSWDDVNGFYSDQMRRAGWEPEPALDVQGDAFQAVGWTRGTGTGQQALVVSYVPDVTGEGAFAIVALFSK